MSRRALAVACVAACPPASTVVLSVLKLSGVIDWPWWQVTAPTWGEAALVLVIVAGAVFDASQVRS